MGIEQIQLPPGDPFEEKLKEIFQAYSTITSAVAKKEDVIKDGDVVIASYTDEQKIAIDGAVLKAWATMEQLANDLASIAQSNGKGGK